MTRTGKIARLSYFVRGELNQRLKDGQPGGEILAWLNEIPTVQKVLRAHFGGRPVNEQNLSDWRAGGYQDWLQHSETREWIAGWIEESQDLEYQAGDNRSVADFLAAPLAVEMARSLRRISTSTEMSEKERLDGILAIARASTQVRRANQMSLQQQLEIERQELEDADEIEAQVRNAEEGAANLKMAFDLITKMNEEKAAKQAERRAKREKREAEKARADGAAPGKSGEPDSAKSPEKPAPPGVAGQGAAPEAMASPARQQEPPADSARAPSDPVVSPSAYSAPPGPAAEPSAAPSPDTTAANRGYGEPVFPDLSKFHAGFRPRFCAG